MKRHIKRTCLVTQFFVLMFLMSVFVLPAQSADNNSCTIKGIVSFTGIPDWGLNAQQFWFSQVDPVNSIYSGGALNLRIDMQLTPGIITTNPVGWSKDDIQQLLAKMINDIELSRDILIYSNTAGLSANHSTVAAIPNIKTPLRDILNGGNGLSVSNDNIRLLVTPRYYKNSSVVQDYTYRFAIRQKTTAISDLKQEVSVDYPLNSPYCAEPSGKIENEYTLTSTYSLSNNSLMNFESNLGGATSNVDTYTFHMVVDFVRELNVNIAAAPDAIDFGILSNTQSAQRDINITFNGLPSKSSVMVDYVFSGLPAWAKASVLDDVSAQVTSETIMANSGDRITRTLKIESPQAQTGDIDGRLTINAALN